jgi:hypothetical protein
MQVVLTMSNGELFQSDFFEADEADVANIVACLEDLGGLEVGNPTTHLAIMVRGTKRYFNPRHIIWAELTD